MINETSLRKQAMTDNVTHFATGIAVFQDGKLLVVRRLAEDDFLGAQWEIPGGGVDAGETVEQGAIRELKEETNLDVDVIIDTFKGFDYSTPEKSKVRQINYRVTVKPGTIKLTEHDQYRWITRDEIPGLETNPVMTQCLVDAFNLAIRSKM